MKRIGKVLGYGALMSSCFAVGFSWPNLQRGEAPDARAIKRLLGIKSDSRDLSSEQVFRQNYNRIITEYYRPVKPLELKYAGMQGMVASLGDPHTLYLPPKEAQAFSDDTKANYAGVGARLAPDPLGAKIATVFEDGPAHAAGVKVGDLITAVNGKSISGQEIDKIVEQIKGPESTVVKLTVIRKGLTKPLELSVKRARIVTPTVDSKILEGTQIGYMTILQFAEPTASQFEHELTRLEGQNMKGLVIDLRGNPGGLLDITAEMLSRFFDRKVVVRMKLRAGRGEQVAQTDSGAVHDLGYPIAILMNEDTASAAEIFSGCMRDYGRAKLVGTHSYGKSSVQNVFPLSDAASAKITIAKYFLPRGGDIGRKVDEFGTFVSGGLQPDVPVELSLDAEALGDLKSDNQLRKAIEVVKQQIQ